MKPRKSHGLTDEQRERVCTGKRRWPDQPSAVASALYAIEEHQEVRKLYTYQCKVCRGWHLTKKWVPGQEAITLAQFAEPPKQTEEKEDVCNPAA